jgi:hypothetical protein
MNLRCIYCQTPFTLARSEMTAAIVQMTEKNMNHYDAHCPRCRRANSISRQRMELFFPNWQEAAKQQMAAPASAPAAAPMPSATGLKTEPLPKAMMKTAMASKSAPKEAATSSPKGKKSAAPSASKAKKPAAAKKTTASKPAAKKKAPAKGKKK